MASFISLLKTNFNRKKQISYSEELENPDDDFDLDEDIDDSDIEPLKTENGDVDEGNADPEEEEYEVVEREILPAKIICPDCGGITLEGLEFCDKCGGEL